MSPVTSESVDFLVGRSDLRTTRFERGPVPEPATGQVLLAVDTFALTANNITYGVFGDAMAYWQFFPAPEGWGRIPVWGFADVAASRCAELPEGERVYGYLPMSTHLVVEPARVTAGSFTDASAHRAALPAVYNQYARTAADPGYDARLEAHQSILRPLFTTSFLIDDFLADNDMFAATRVLLGSASSKTAIAAAFCLRDAGRGKVVGLTSPRNEAFCKKLGCYDEVVVYDAIGGVDAAEQAVFVDMAGAGDVTAAVHRRLGDALRYSCVVGATHWEERGAGAALPGPTPTLFFAPTQVAKRLEDWGPAGFESRVAAAWKRFLAFTEGWLEVESARGEAAVERVYREVLEGRTAPEKGMILSLRAS